MKKIGLTTTVPVEVILAKGYIPCDINNLFVTDDNYVKYIDIAERDGFPKNMCAWIKGIYGVCIDQEIDEIVGVVEGDCSNTKAMLEVLQTRGIKVHPFSFPHNHKIESIEEEIEKFMEEFDVKLDAVEAVRERLKSSRDLAKEIDELTYIEGKATGFENHLYQVMTSDFCGDIELFDKILKEGICTIKARKPDVKSLRIGYIGVPPMTADLYEFVESLDAKIVYNEVQREFSFPRGCEADSIFKQYHDYTYPYDINFRMEDVIKQIEHRKLDAIIHYTQAFCYRAIEDIVLRQNLDVPMLNIEGDKLNILDARTKLRLEAFIDMLHDSKGLKV